MFFFHRANLFSFMESASSISFFSVFLMHCKNIPNQSLIFIRLTLCANIYHLSLMLSWIKFHFTFSFYPSFYPLHLSPPLLEDLDTSERKTKRKPSIPLPSHLQFYKSSQTTKRLPWSSPYIILIQFSPGKQIFCCDSKILFICVREIQHVFLWTMICSPQTFRRSRNENNDTILLPEQKRNNFFFSYLVWLFWKEMMMQLH